VHRYGWCLALNVVKSVVGVVLDNGDEGHGWRWVVKRRSFKAFVMVLDLPFQ